VVGLGNGMVFFGFGRGVGMSGIEDEIGI